MGAGSGLDPDDQRCVGETFATVARELALAFFPGDNVPDEHHAWLRLFTGSALVLRMARQRGTSQGPWYSMREEAVLPHRVPITDPGGKTLGSLQDCLQSRATGPPSAVGDYDDGRADDHALGLCYERVLFHELPRYLPIQLNRFKRVQIDAGAWEIRKLYHTVQFDPVVSLFPYTMNGYAAPSQRQQAQHAAFLREWTGAPISESDATYALKAVVTHANDNRDGNGGGHCRLFIRLGATPSKSGDWGSDWFIIDDETVAPVSVNDARVENAEGGNSGRGTGLGTICRHLSRLRFSCTKPPGPHPTLRWKRANG